MELPTRITQATTSAATGSSVVGAVRRPGELATSNRRLVLRGNRMEVVYEAAEPSRRRPPGGGGGQGGPTAVVRGSDVGPRRPFEASSHHLQPSIDFLYDVL